MESLPATINPQVLLGSSQVWPSQATTPFRRPYPALPEIALGSPTTSIWTASVPNTHDIEHIDNTASPTADLARARGPSQEEWYQHRATITELYSNQGKPLPQVMEHMKTHHNFVASVKMYKIRIKHWQLDKKFKKHEAIAMLVLQAYHQASGRSPTFSIRGKQIDQSALKRYVKRAHITARDLLGLTPHDAHRMVPNLVCQVESRTLQAIRAPDELSRIESVLKSVRDYVAGAIDSSLCWTDSNGCLVWKSGGSFVMLDQFEAFLSLSTKKYQSNMFHEAGVCWRNAFVRLEALINSQHPFIHIALTNSIHYHGAQLPAEISKALRRHIKDLISVQIEEFSPQKSLAWNFCRLDSAHTKEVLGTCEAVIFQTLSPFVSQIGLMDLVQALFQAPLYLGFNSVTRSYVRDAMDGFECTETVEQMIDSSPGILDSRLYYLYRTDRNDECRELSHLILSLASSKPDDVLKSLLVRQCMIVLAYLEIEDNNFSEAQHWMIKYLQFCEEMAILYDEPLITDDLRYEIYEDLDWISNHSNIADGNQEWRQKMNVIQKNWEDDLVAEVGELSLDTVSGWN